MQASEEKKATDDIEACCGVPLTDDKQSKRIAVCLMAVGLFLFALGFGFSAKFMFCELRVTWCRNGGICKLTPEENRRMDSIKGSFYTAGPDTDGCVISNAVFWTCMTAELVGALIGSVGVGHATAIRDASKKKEKAGKQSPAVLVDTVAINCEEAQSAMPSATAANAAIV